ncbi:ABC transporter permease [Streptomyces sp. CA-111067]|uniref:ABC transporter permease n=1 Tax=Streptomyces sp. CA-111067 TaxID=3240046 RepID=UPI003D96CC5A
MSALTDTTGATDVPVKASTDDRPASVPGARSRRTLPLPAKIAAAVVLLVVLAALFAPLLAPSSPTQGSLADRLHTIGSSGHLLGTDGQGRDILSRMLYGARPSLLTGLIPVAVSGSAGTVLGLVAGLGAKVTRGLVMRVLDVFYAFPAVLLAIAIAAALGSGISNSIIALSVILIPPVARVAEAETARFRSADFIEAARASGASKASIALRQVLPNIAPAVMVYCTALIGLSIVSAAGLSFLGLGISPPAAEWGLMISDLQQYIFTEPQLLLVPVVAILVVSVAFNVLGDGLRSYLNVRLDTA